MERFGIALAIVDDATHEAVALVPEHTIGGEHLTRIMDGVCSQRGKPAIIRVLASMSVIMAMGFSP